MVSRKTLFAGFGTIVVLLAAVGGFAAFQMGMFDELGDDDTSTQGTSPQTDPATENGTSEPDIVDVRIDLTDPHGQLADVQRGAVTLHHPDRENESMTIPDNGTVMFSSLEPSEEYRVEVIPSIYPSTNYSFTAGEQSSYEVEVGYEFAGADTYRADFDIILPDKEQDQVSVWQGTTKVEANQFINGRISDAPLNGGVYTEWAVASGTLSGDAPLPDPRDAADLRAEAYVTGDDTRTEFNVGGEWETVDHQLVIDDYYHEVVRSSASGWPERVYETTYTNEGATYDIYRLPEQRAFIHVERESGYVSRMSYQTEIVEGERIVPGIPSTHPQSGAAHSHTKGIASITVEYQTDQDGYQIQPD